MRAIGAVSFGLRLAAAAAALWGCFFAFPAALPAFSPPPGTAIVNNAFVDYADQNGQEQPRLAATAETIVGAAPVLSVGKEAASNPVAYGGVFDYTITVTNTGNAPAADIVVTDQLSRHLEFRAASHGGVFAPGPPGDGTVTWDIGSLPPGGSQVLGLTVRVRTPADYPPGDPDPIGSGSIIFNTATAVSPQAAGGTTIATAVGNAPNLGICQAVSSTITAPGEVLTYTISYRNTGNSEATGVLVTNEIPPLTALEPGSVSGGGTVSDRTITWPVGTLEPGGEGVVSFSVRVSPAAETGTVITSSSSIISREQAGVSCAPVSSVVAEAPALVDIFKTAAPAAVYPGGDITYVIEIVNSGTHVLTGVTVRDILPANTVLVSADGGGVFTGGGVTWNVGNLAPAETRTFELVVTVAADAPGGLVVSNEATVDCDQLDTWHASADTPVSDLPLDLVVSKQVSRRAVSVGDLVRYVVTVENKGQTTVEVVKVYDTMPRGVVYRPGSATLGGTPFDEPVAENGRTLAWTIPDLAAGAMVELAYTAVIGAESNRGDGKNSVLARGKNALSNSAYAQVIISEGVFTSKGTIIGKVFLDRNGNRIQDPSEEGIGEVAIYLEDGTRVVTDEQGRYSIPMVTPGTRVLRVDEATLPPGVSLVPLNNRFGGTGASKFVYLTRHGLSKANFAAVEKDFPLVEPATVAGRPEQGDGVTGELSGANVEGLPAETRAIYSEYLESDMPGREPPALGKDETSALPGRMEDAPVARDALEEAIREMTPEPAFLNLEDGMFLQVDHARVLLKAPLDMETVLLVNGNRVSDRRIGRRVEYRAGNVVVYEFIAVNLVPGEKNVLALEVSDQFGNVRMEESVAIVVAGAPEQVLVLPESDTSPADGRSLLPVRVVLLDRAGNRTSWSGTVTVSIDAGETREKDADALASGHQVLLRDGVAFFNVIAPFQPSTCEIKVFADGAEGRAKVDFTPFLRDMLLAGLGELKLGRGSMSGAGWPGDVRRDGLYSESRLAFFLKGRVFSDMLLTASYDSEKPDRDDFFRQAERNVESPERYPVYGDESEKGHEAVSADRLYVRIDKGMSHVMYGDFRTGLTDTRLAAFTRTFTGLDTEINAGRFCLRAFASRTARGQIIDTLTGRGISGYYYLSSTPVIEGSERVVIETRDRYRADRVLKREFMTSGHDYWLDPDTGALLFKSPVPSMDGDLNPLFIIVSYESDSEDRKYYAYGGRVTYRPAENLELGLTSITEEKGLGDYQLLGADLNLQLPAGTRVRAEWATTHSLFESAGLYTFKRGQGWSFEMESAPLENLLLKAYYTKLGDYFSNLSATDVTRGTEKFGGEIRHRSDDGQRTVSASYFREKDTLNHSGHEHVSAGLEKMFGRVRAGVETYYEHSEGGYIQPADLETRHLFDAIREMPEKAAGLRLRLEKKFTGGLTLSAEHKSNFLSSAGNMGQVGLEYQVDKHRRFYLRQQFARLEERSEARTVLGVEAQVADNTVAFSEYRLADGMSGRNAQQGIGLRNKFLLGENITGSISAENLYTVSGKERQGEPDAFALAGGLEYLPREHVKLTSRLEYRRATDESSYLAECGLAYRLNPDYTALLRSRFFFNDLAAGARITSRTTLGLAYRPVDSDRFHALARLEMGKDKDDASPAGLDSDSYMLSVEGIRQFDAATRISGKYAGKLVRDHDTSSYSDLIAARVTRDIGARFDLGVEYRVFRSHRVDNISHGGSLEVGCRLFKNAWLSLGYSFDRFDQDLTGGSYSSKGPFLAFRLKLEENMFRK